MSQVDLSVVTPCYDEVENLDRLHDELTRVLGAAGIDYELVWVENGSSDGSIEKMEALAEADPRLRIVQLSRNFSYQGGISAGMAFASGDHVVCIDADLQDPVDLIPAMYEKATAEGYDIVYGIRRTRQEGLFQRLAYRAFYRLMRATAPIDVPLDAGDFALVNKSVLDALRSLPEQDRFLRGLRAWVGFRATGIEYDRRARERGASKFSVTSQFLLAFQGLFSFSFLPLRLLFYGGICVCAAVVPMFVAYLLWRLLAPEAWPAGIATIVLLLLVQIGVTMAGIGLIGEYLAIVFIETKRRPTFIVRRLVNVDTRDRGVPS